MSLTEVLPTEPVTPSDLGAERAPAGAGERLERGERIGGGEDPGGAVRPRWRRAARIGTARPAPTRSRARADDDAPGARPRSRPRRTRRRRGSRRAGRRRGRRAPPQRSRSPRGAAARSTLRRAAARAGRRRDLLAAQPHAGLPSLRSSSRATSRSSKGILRPPSNSCPCSWPLPAITTVSPGSARPSASAIAAWRSTSTDQLGVALARPGGDFGDDRLGVLGARVVGGDDGEVGERRPRPVPSAAAWPCRGRRRQPKTTISRPAVSRRAARSTFSIESGVWA